MQVRLEGYRWGAAVATALVNTAPEVMVSSGDRLADPDALLGFLAEHDLHPDALAGGRRPTPEELADVHALRRTLRGLLDSRDQAGVVAQAGRLAADAGTGPTLRPDGDGRWQWWVASRRDAGLAGELALLTATALLAVVRVLGHDRFRPCASPACNGAFVDTSRAGRRRYCEPEVCGNRINVANYRARHRAGQAAAERGDR